MAGPGDTGDLSQMEKGSRLERLATWMETPSSPSYLPADLKLADLNTIRATHDISLNNEIVFLRLLLAGSAGFSIVVFNSASALLNTKAFEKGLPWFIQIGFVLLAITLLISFISAGQAYIFSLSCMERFAVVKHAMTSGDVALYAEARANYCARSEKAAAAAVRATLAFLLSLIVSVALLLLIVSAQNLS